MQASLLMVLVLTVTTEDAETLKKGMREAYAACGINAACQVRVSREWNEKIKAAEAAQKASAPALACDCEALKTQALDQSDRVEELTEQLKELTEQRTKLQAELKRAKGLGKLVSSEGVGKAKWGTSVKKLKRVYKVKKSGDGYVRSLTVAGMSAYQMYWFTQDKLTVSTTLFGERYSNKNEYVNQFNKLRELLTQKYGEPKRVWADWSQDMYRDMPEHIGFAIANGHVQFIGYWRTEKTGIELVLSGNNREVSLRVRYHSIELEDLQKQAEQADHLADL